MKRGAGDAAEFCASETAAGKQKTWSGTEALKQVLVHCTIYILLYID